MRLACLFSIAFLLPLQAADVTLRGRVTDEIGAPVDAARITVNPGARQTQTNPTGAFTIVLPDFGDYTVTVDRQGYYALKDRPVHIDTTSAEAALTITSVREVFQSVDVNDQPSPVDIAQTRNQESLTGTEVNDILYPNSHSLRASMKLMPGVIPDAAGSLHFNGSQENQVLYLLNGFNITDPVSGQFHTVLAVEGIRSLDFSSGRDSPEFGKGSAGALAITTENGTDAFHYTATNFIPGFQIQQGLRLGNWFPRVGVSGPILRGKAWFSDTFHSEFDQSLVVGLPRGQNTRSGWTGSNLLHTQWNLAPAHILFADFLVNIDNQNRVGLGVLDPVSTTLTTKARELFLSVKDQYYLGRGALLEFGYAHNYFSNTQIPQGPSLYIYSPQGRSGNNFQNLAHTADRDQGLVHGFLPTVHGLGQHQIEAGADADLLRYYADFRRTGYEVVGLSGAVLSQTIFQGAGVFQVRDTEMSSYLLDKWRFSKQLQLNLGIRQDWDQRVDNLAWSPRLAFSWAPFESGRTRVSGGYSITRDAVPLDLIGRPQDQTALTNGVATTIFTAPGKLKLPGASNASLSIDHQISARIHASAKYLRRRSSDEFSFQNIVDPQAPLSALPLASGTLPGVYHLNNLRRDHYTALEFSVHQTFAGQFEWTASYTHSLARSNGLLDNSPLAPLQLLPNLISVPWDVPNRVLAWAYFPLPFKNWAASLVADAAGGFPFSAQDQTGLIVGAPESHHYPLHFEIDASLERIVTLRGYRFALRGGVNNVTGRQNPTAVNNVFGAPQFLQFYGSEGRHFVVRIRFFGHALHP
jgi:hypothetical protein